LINDLALGIGNYLEIVTWDLGIKKIPVYFV
jgi:hypothetical protein